MFGSGRTVGLVAILGGVLFGCTGTTLSVAVANGDVGGMPDKMILGIALSLLISAFVTGFGTLLFRRGRKELRQLATIKKQKRILNMVRSQGHVEISKIVSELGANMNEVKYLIYDLVDEDLFHGFIDWDDAILYSRHTVVLQGATHCPNCYGEQKFVGKGIIQCRHCGAQVFL